jgi:hypothetical protein
VKTLGFWEAYFGATHLSLLILDVGEMLIYYPI